MELTHFALRANRESAFWAGSLRRVGYNALAILRRSIVAKSTTKLPFHGKHLQSHEEDSIDLASTYCRWIDWAAAVTPFPFHAFLETRPEFQFRTRNANHGNGQNRGPSPYLAAFHWKVKAAFGVRFRVGTSESLLRPTWASHERPRTNTAFLHHWSSIRWGVLPTVTNGEAHV
jgi:hypothetical protein